MSKTAEPIITAITASNVKISDAVILDEPVTRGDTTISSVQVRKPQSGELRGATLAGLLQLDVTELIRVLPRITVPTLLQHEVEKLDPADLVNLGSEVVSFFVSKKDRASLPV